MTGSGHFPPLLFDYDGNWVSLDLSGDVDTWAKSAAHTTLLRDGPKPSRRAVRNLAEHLTAAGRLARSVDDSMVTLLLCPPPARRVLAGLRLVAVEISDADLADGIATGRRMVDPDGIATIEPVEVTELDSAAGPVARGRARVAGAEPERQVSEWLNYAWVIPPYRYAALLTTVFQDLLVAGLWRPAIDTLVTGVSLESRE